MAYTVQRGDTLSAIARANNTTVTALLEANPDITNPDRIQIGQVVELPGETSGEAATESDSGTLDTTPEINEDSEQAILDIFPSAASWLQVPELRPILEEATRDGWSSSRLIAAIEETEWWQTTSNSARVFDEQEKRDPASLRQRLDREEFEVRRMAMTAGIAMAPGRITEISRNAVRLGWTEDQVRDALFQAANDENIKDVGSISADTQNILGMARQYHVPLSEEDAQMYALRMWNGTLDQNTVRTILQQNAMAVFPHLSEQLQMGLTVEDYMRPLVNVAAQELDMNPNAIDLTGTKFSDLYGLSSYSDVRMWARNQPEWQYTDKANDEADAMTLSLLKTFGVMA